MRKRVFAHLGVLVIAALTIQTATAAARHTRKAARNLVPVTHQLRDAFGSAPEAVFSWHDLSTQVCTSTGNQSVAARL
jgi:hypothetical protein